ncbi:MAG TPA: hypothetical protein VM287_13260, partial [Egibacteraceae bacterium]|nr:hypothetical protein [Egibacteraceae bacterium]
KVLEDAVVKLGSVASSVLSKSGRAMIEALIAGERDPAVLADLAKARMRAKIPELVRALDGRFGAGLACRPLPPASPSGPAALFTSQHRMAVAARPPHPAQLRIASLALGRFTTQGCRVHP